MPAHGSPNVRAVHAFCPLHGFFAVSVLVPAGPIPGARSDGEPLKDWMIAVIALVAGILLLAIVVLALWCFKRRKKEHGGTYKIVQPVVKKAFRYKCVFFSGRQIAVNVLRASTFKGVLDSSGKFRRF